MKSSKIIALMCVLTISLGFANTQAAVYRWVDSSGKVHFGDRAPSGQKSSEISDSLRHTNLDSSGKTRDKLTKIFTSATVLERQYEVRKQNSRALDKREQCAKAKARLQALQGAVSLFDRNGKPVPLSERGRQRMERAQAAQVAALGC